MLELYVGFQSWLAEQEGQDLAEYALLIGLIALVVLLAVTVLGTNLSTLFSSIASRVSSWGIGGG
ncbi:Flp family type IVb pilin [Chloroflexota bacterium]